MKEQKIDLALALPDEAGACDACVARLVQSLNGRAGVERAHVDRSDPAAPKLCLHYDPSTFAPAELRALVEAAGAELTARFEHLSIPLNGLRHARQANLVEGVFARQPGVLRVNVSFGARRLYVELDPARTTRAALIELAARAGVTTSATPAPLAERGEEHATPTGEHGEHEHGGPFGERTELVFSLTCGVLTASGWALGKLDVPSALPTVLFIAAYVLGSWFTLQEVVVALRARRFEIDFLMLLAALGAAVLGEWFEGALLLFLFTLGHALEGFAMKRAAQAISALGALVPKTALRLDDTGATSEVAITTLAVGDRILVKPNTRMPADGVVADGASSVDQAPITGESVPVEKRAIDDVQRALASPSSIPAEHRVFAGTINGAGALTLVVTKTSADSTLARMVTMVTEAEKQKSPTQLFTDRFERLFVPVVLALVGVLLLSGLVTSEPFSETFYRAMAVLVAASPCALAIATPSAVLSGVARAARRGVLIKGGAHLESLGIVRAFAFDKTGTLTEGRPRLTDVLALDGASDDELLGIALAVERQSDHPLARAVVEGAGERFEADRVLPKASDVEGIIGFGVRAQVAGERVSIGKPGLFTRDGPLPATAQAAVEQLLAGGRTVLVVQHGKRFLGALGVMDTPRDSAREVIAQLHRLGVEETIMLSGDNQPVADAVAKAVGIRTARGDLLPEHKVATIEELARAGGVAMVGDGVNDAPAMAKATIGIAMGAGGSDVALETADVALMGDDLRALPFAVELSRAARAIIRQNLWASLGMVAFLIPATIIGFAGIGAAVALHEGSTLLVVANALRLLAHKGSGGDAPKRSKLS